jgi:hypothetical protein
MPNTNRILTMLQKPMRCGRGFPAVTLIGCALALAVLCWRPAVSKGAENNADKAQPTAFLMLPGSDELMAGAHYILNLTNATEQKQWPVLKSYFEVFLIGVDPKLPTRVGVIFGDKSDRYIWSVPVSKFPNFRKNNVASIITPHIREVGNNLFKLGNGRASDFNGFMLYTPPYAHIGETQKDVTEVPADPRPELQPLLSRNFLAAIVVDNKQTDAASQTKRREIFQATRKQSLAALKKEKGETQADFDLRKKALEIQLDEIEWFFAEGQHTLLGLTLDQKQGTGRLDLDMTPIPGTPLAQSVDQLQTKPSHFANIAKSADPILSARINHPLSEVRKKTASAMATLAKDRVAARIDADQKLSADQKQASKQILEQSFGLLEAGFKAGLADGFLDIHKGPSGKNVLLGAVWTPDGTKVPDILALLPKARAGENVKLNVAEESGVKIHSVDLAKDHLYWNDFIGATTLYVGSAKEAVWVAAGEGALDNLKAAIKKAAQPAPAGAEKAPWGDLVVHLKPFVDTANSQPPKKKGDDKYRKMLLASFQGGDDQLSVRLTRQEHRIVGELNVQKGLLRFIGKAASDFSRENLDETSQKGSKQARESR